VQHILTKSFWFFVNHSIENTITIICDILNHSQRNFFIEIKQISWSCPDPTFSKMNFQIQSWSKKIASILQNIQSWSCPCSPLLYTLASLDFTLSVSEYVTTNVTEKSSYIYTRTKSMLCCSLSHVHLQNSHGFKKMTFLSVHHTV